MHLTVNQSASITHNNVKSVEVRFKIARPVRCNQLAKSVNEYLNGWKKSQLLHFYYSMRPAISLNIPPLSSHQRWFLAAWPACFLCRFVLKCFCTRKKALGNQTKTRFFSSQRIFAHLISSFLMNRRPVRAWFKNNRKHSGALQPWPRLFADFTLALPDKSFKRAPLLWQYEDISSQHLIINNF